MLTMPHAPVVMPVRTARSRLLPQTAVPFAAKLLSGAQNVSYQANATRDAAKQAVVVAHRRLERLREDLDTAVATKQAARSVFRGVPVQWGKAQFKVAGATGTLWAAEAAWAATKQMMEMNRAAVKRVQAAVAHTLDTPVAMSAHHKLQAAEARLQVGAACCLSSPMLPPAPGSRL
jgi:hypothetical protein